MRTFLAAIAASILVLTGVSAADAAPSPYKVSIKLNHTYSNAGGSVLVSGYVTGSKANGSSVKVQRKYVGGSWKTVATDQISSNRYAAWVETPRGGNTSFRAVKGASTTHSAGTSATKTIKVYEWLYLANETGFAQYGGGYMAPIEAQLGSTLYTRSIGFFFGQSVVTWNVAGACTELRMTADYTSSRNPLPASVDFEVRRWQTDNTVPVTTTTRAPNAGPVAITAPLASTRVLELALVHLESEDNAFLGNPRIRCNLDHLPSYTA